MNNPRALRSNIFTESLADETILYDKAAHKAHSLNKTVAMVWESADGQKSVGEIAGVLHRNLGLPEDRSIVLLALEELQTAGLLETTPEVGEGEERPSRRQVARRLALAGASVGLVPLVASVLAPTPAMASSMTSLTYTQIVSEETTTSIDMAEHPLKDTQAVINEYDAGATLGGEGEVAALQGQNAVAQVDFASAQSDFNSVLKALGLPPF